MKAQVFSGLGGAALVALLATTAIGCAGPGAHEVDWTRESRAPTGPDDQPVWLREVTVDAIAANTTADRALPEERFDVSKTIVRDVVTDALRKLGVARRVESCSGPTTVVEGASLPGSGLIVDVALESTALVHMGENDQATKAFWLWLLTGLPGDSVRDQLYEVACAPVFQICDGATGVVLVPWQSLAAPDLGPYALNFHERTTGAGHYILSNVCPPSAISIDPDEVVRQILPATLRPALTRLADRVREISFVPVSRLSVESFNTPGVKVESATVPAESRSDEVALTLVLQLERGPASLLGVQAGGKVKLEFPNGAATPLAKDGKLELHVDVEVPPAGSIDVELLLDGDAQPRQVARITAAAQGTLRPELLETR